MSTDAVITHLSWIAKLGLRNCVVAPEVWDVEHVKRLREQGFRADVLLSLSVIHHICRLSEERRQCRRMKAPRWDASQSLRLLVELLHLADVHILELPEPQLPRLGRTATSTSAVLQEATELVGGAWEMRLIHRSRWLGERELWLIARDPPSEKPHGEAGVYNFFPVLVPRKPWSGPPLLAHVLKAITSALGEKDNEALLKCRGLVAEYIREDRGGGRTETRAGLVGVQGATARSAIMDDSPLSLSSDMIEATMRFAQLWLARGAGEGESARAAWQVLVRPAGALQSCLLDKLSVSGSAGAVLARLLSQIGHRLFS
jgi:hypothetical protein